jgi:hypothetical protein
MASPLCGNAAAWTSRSKPTCSSQSSPLFEGFRPKEAGSGTGALSFELTPGPFRLFAEAAKDHPTTAYILIIDEINRANLSCADGRSA